MIFQFPILSMLKERALVFNILSWFVHDENGFSWKWGSFSRQLVFDDLMSYISSVLPTGSSTALGLLSIYVFKQCMIDAIHFYKGYSLYFKHIFPIYIEE